MPVTRQELALHLAREFAELVAATNIDPAENEGFAASIDTALRMLGHADTDLVGPFDDSAQALYAVAEWAALRRIQRAAAKAVDIDVDGPTTSKKRSQLFTQVSTLVAQAWMEAQRYIEVDAQDDWQVGRFNLDLLAPAEIGVATDGLT